LSYHKERGERAFRRLSPARAPNWEAMEIRSRRAFMRSAICGAAGLAAPRLALAQPAPAPAGRDAGPVEIRPLGPDTILVTGTGTNVVAAADSDGVILVD